MLTIKVRKTQKAKLKKSITDEFKCKWTIAQLYSLTPTINLMGQWKMYIPYDIFPQKRKKGIFKKVESKLPGCMPLYKKQAYSIATTVYPAVEKKELTKNALPETAIPVASNNNSA